MLAFLKIIGVIVLITVIIYGAYAWFKMSHNEVKRTFDDDTKT